MYRNNRLEILVSWWGHIKTEVEFWTNRTTCQDSRKLGEGYIQVFKVNFLKIELKGFLAVWWRAKYFFFLLSYSSSSAVLPSLSWGGGTKDEQIPYWYWHYSSMYQYHMKGLILHRRMLWQNRLQYSYQHFKRRQEREKGYYVT